MSNSINDPSRYCAFIGIDWADKNHDICIQEKNSNKFERLTVEHSPEKSMTTGIAGSLRKPP